MVKASLFTSIRDVNLASNYDLQLAIEASGRKHDPERQLSDVLHYLTRAIPALSPLVPLLERETGRKLLP